MDKIKNFLCSRRLWRVLSLTAAIVSGAWLVFLGTLMALASSVSDQAESSSAAIIGGADGPTMIFVSTTGSPWAELLKWTLIFAAFLFVSIRLGKTKQK